MFKKILALTILAAVAAWSCANKAAENEGALKAADTSTVDSVSLHNSAAEPPPVNYTVDTFLNDYASYISGMPSQRYFTSFSSDSSYIRLERRISREWDLMLESKINGMRSWADSVVAPATDSASLFYPFAGADFLHVDPFFKNINRYVMVGLEPLGTTLADTASKHVMKAHADKIYASLYFSNRLGFFRTVSMKAELNQRELNGALPLLFFYIKRFGYSISSLEYFNLDTSGSTIICEPSKAIGLKIKFHDFKGPIRELDYFRFDLSNGGLANDDRLLKHAGKIRPFGVFLKAASYLMHGESFTSIRSFITDNARFVLQDDSGIPLASFGEDAWNRQLWGTYTKTIGLFRSKFQPALAEAYKTSPGLPLSFYIGYNISHKECNLMWFVKKGDAVTPAAQSKAETDSSATN
ncbi:MAG: hypothetical protein ACKOQ6_03035 [Bacteroidota bacterium]